MANFLDKVLDKEFSRRTFLKGTAAVAAAVPFRKVLRLNSLSRTLSKMFDMKFPLQIK